MTTRRRLDRAGLVPESLGAVPGVRLAGAGALLCRGALYGAAGRAYRATADVCRAARICPPGLAKHLAKRIVLRSVRRDIERGRSSLLNAYQADSFSAATAALYSLTGRGPHDLFRDLIVLKRTRTGERGVVLLKYARTFDAVAALFDIERLMERYTFVLEPCWAGYCDPSILMFAGLGRPVIVQCFTPEDFSFIEEVGPPLVPVRLGPADWVDSSVFTSMTACEKVYDVVMVANWALHKRHSTLFRALATIRDRDLTVLLIGFPWAGRTAADVRREAAATANPRMRVEILERLPHAEVAACLARSRAFVFLSKKEGDNKALVEALFADVPAIVFKDSIGGATSRINEATGLLTSDADLARSITYVLDHRDQFAPRAWALQHTGSAIATRVLTQTIGRALTERGEAFEEPLFEKTNSPNLAYRHPAARALVNDDIEAILACRRKVPGLDP